MALFRIELRQVRFTAPHGLHPEEAIVGNAFQVDIRLYLPAPPPPISIHNTVDYSVVYALVKECFAQRRQLLEELTIAIAETVKQQYPALKKIQVRIAKLHPPIAGFEGKVAVTYKKKF